MTVIPPEHAAELTRCYRALSGRVFGYARSQLGVATAAAHDLVHRAFQDAAEKWAELREQPEEARLRFLCAAVWCDAVDSARRERTAREKQPQLWQATRPRPVDPFEAVSVKLLIEAFNKKIADMPPRRREVAELKWGRQLGNTEIAVILGITAKAVSSHVAAARAALAKVREEMQGDDGDARNGGDGS